MWNDYAPGPKKVPGKSENEEAMAVTLLWGPNGRIRVSRRY